MKKEYAAYLINKTREDYNLISEQFSSTRQYIWRDLEPLIDYTKSGDRVLDLGCGNGRLLKVLKDKKVEYIGVDNSEKLIEAARREFPGENFQVADILHLSFPDNYFDKIYCIAVLHHIPSNEFRLQVLKEIKRVLRPGGLLILTVWNLWQRKTSWEAFFKQTFLKIIGLSKLDLRDILVPWKNKEGKILVQRYYHLFTEKELKKLAQCVGFKIKEIGLTRRPESKDNNIYLVAEK